ncbi:similar to Saccharomyces cerevisiae YDR116C MRPL1 Mitochondrial ribosomal protein of the large subunit [Maudiozyma saulgeensis]|uniref:Ribosomal protein n=1 Tax=Maudiozyma saulgeensis TaxID=1789683 RepID=A0A1X7R627_9SACH|nr:similar to Saccharomyces cerevisiae YDR116C MRPL1 Mitochondrial ribosomal protein of the large subunit [Kazachstania saulgeensis]
MISSLSTRPLVHGLKQTQRFLSTSHMLLAEEVTESKGDSTVTLATPAKVLTKEQLKKRELRKFLKSKADARKPATDYPLYMDIPKVLRYLRAAEVGQPLSQRTVSLTTLVVGEKGVPPLYGNVSFPTPLRKSKVAVFSNDVEKLEELKKQYDLHLAGGVEVIAAIKDGSIKIDFDKAFATPDIVSTLTAQLGRILGPRGVLPNVKKGTVSDDLLTLIRENLGTMPFRERNKCISIGVGKTSFSDEQIIQNIIAARKAIKDSITTQKAKKQSMLSKTTLTSSHGPGLVIDFN